MKLDDCVSARLSVCLSARLSVCHSMMRRDCRAREMGGAALCAIAFQPCLSPVAQHSIAQHSMLMAPRGTTAQTDGRADADGRTEGGNFRSQLDT